MLEYLSNAYDVAIDISPDDMIGALVIGLGLAMACSGLCLLAHKKSTNPYPLLCGLIFAVSTTSLAIGVLHSRIKYTGISKMSGGNNAYSHLGAKPGHGGPPMPRRFGRPWFHDADADGNGQLTPEEAARYVREADSTGKGWIDIAEFDRSRRGRGGPLAVSGNPPGPGKPAPDPSRH